MIKKEKLCVLDVSDHVNEFEDLYFKEEMFHKELNIEIHSFHVATNQWPLSSSTINIDNNNNTHNNNNNNNNNKEEIIIDDNKEEEEIINQILQYIQNNFIGIVISGSVDCCLDDSLIYIKRLMTIIKKLIEINFPILGICFGSQLIIRTLFGNKYIVHLKNLQQEPEFGFIKIKLTTEGLQNLLFKHFNENHNEFIMSSSHGDGFLLEQLAKEKKIIHLAFSTYWSNQAYQINNKNCWGLQFHPEFNANVTNGIIEIALKDGFIKRTFRDGDLKEEEREEIATRIAKNFIFICLENVEKKNLNNI